MSKERALRAFDLQSLREKLSPQRGRTYWKSLDQLAETEEFQDYLKHEFPAGADTWLDPVGRRRFLQLMGASLAFAGLTNCTMQPEERIVPYVRAPEEVIPGKPLFYASAIPMLGYAQGTLVESHDGRPTKVEGNPKHPASLGATTLHAQASVLDLYDPDRLTVTTNAGRVRSWEVFAATLTNQMERYRLNGGKGLCILTGNVTSPTLGHQFEQLSSAMPEARWYQYEPVNLDSVHEGGRMAFGRDVNTYYRLDKARRILSLDADFLFFGPACIRHTKDFSAQRRMESPDQEMNRLYMVESAPTVTAAMADHRLAVRHSEVLGIARAFARALGIDVPESSALDDATRTWVQAAADDLKEHGGASVVIPGEFQPPVLHALVHLINDKLGASGSTTVHTASVESAPQLHGPNLVRLVEEMRNGEIETLVIVGGNPAFDAPADLDFGGALEHVPLRIHLTQQENETSSLCDWQIPESHFLESWGDLRAFDGTVSVVQPLIVPLYRSKSAVELMDLILGGDGAASDYDIVRTHWSRESGQADFDHWWRRVLYDGTMPDTALPEIVVRVNRQSVLDAIAAISTPESDLELIFRPDPHIYDGRYANNGWLQEAPKPLTKLTWDNAVLLAPATAQKLGIQPGQVVKVRLGESELSGPAWIHPGHPKRAVTIHVGYGRRQVGRVGTGAGFDAFKLRTTGALWAAPGVEVIPTSDSYDLACTQDHSSMEGRPLIVESTLEEFRKNPGFAKEAWETPGPDVNMYPERKYEGRAWGLSVDLNTCIGCNACVLACQSENNIAVVGRDQVRNGREMHWIRIDRYFSGDLDQPETLHQPVMCQQCENAPCETVCPVGATNHSDEGLNDMVYNRCIGTRYCSNNCPYKVRRFNFLLYSDWQTETLKLQRNPDVTVRSRGVMEKCTYCVQRINAAKIQAELEDRDVADGEIKTACQQVCPADAIVFGNINDPQSEVARRKKNPRDYGILTELKTRPRTTYLARLRNPNPRIPEPDRQDEKA